MRQTQSSFPGRNSYRDFRERLQVLITLQKTFDSITKSESARWGSGIPGIPEKIRQNTQNSSK